MPSIGSDGPADKQRGQVTRPAFEPKIMDGTAHITAAMLYDLAQCPHRVTLDLFGDPAKRDEVSPFVQLLWDRGALFEKEVVDRLEVPFSDFAQYRPEEREQLTLEAMEGGDPLIYQGRIRADDLLGEPDLLRREGDGYVAGDIKSGAGEERGTDIHEAKPKRHYAVQLGLYTDVLERLGKSAGRWAFVWDVHGEEVRYDFDVIYGKRPPRTLWQDYQEALSRARAIVARNEVTLPAYASGTCKNCVWYSACLKELDAADDLTLIPQLGRSARDAMRDNIATVRDLAASDPSAFQDGRRTIFPGVGPPSLEKFHARAKLLSAKGAKPYLKAPVSLPAHETELFFDIEVDPMRDLCYLHGFVERRGEDNATERFVFFIADEPSGEAERQAFAQAVSYVQAMQPCGIYYYSKYERTWYRRLRARYPDVASEEALEALFDPETAVDLYDVVLKATEWPVRDYSIKTLAKYLGFAWRDPHPSGAASIEWYHRWTETGDTVLRQRILDYNEDDCRATRVLLDGIRSLVSSGSTS